MRTPLMTVIGLVVMMSLAGCGAQTAEELLAEGGQLMANRDTYGAEVKFQQVIEKHPGTPEAMTARQALAEIYKQTNDPANAIAQYDLLIEELGGAQTPDGFKVFLAKVQVPTLQSDFKSAIAMMMETSATMQGIPVDGELMYLGNLMNLYLLDKQQDKAVAILDRYEEIAVQTSQTQPMIVSILGDISRQAEMAPSVIEFHKNLLVKFPESLLRARILFEIYRLEEGLGRKEEAGRHLEEAIAAQKELVAAAMGEEEKSASILNLGNLYQARGDKEAARGEYGKVIEQYPKSMGAAMSLHFLADLDVLDGHYEEAEKKLRRIETEFAGSEHGLQATQKLAMLANRPSTATLTAPGVRGAVLEGPGLEAPVVEGPMSAEVLSTTGTAMPGGAMPEAGTSPATEGPASPQATGAATQP